MLSHVSRANPILVLAKARTVRSFRTHFSFNFISVQRIGCFKDTSRRAIPQLDGRSRFLRGNYQRRKFAIEKCVLEAVRRGYKAIGVQNGGWCASGPRALRTYAKYGRSNRCRSGKGGPWANDVYLISGRQGAYFVNFSWFSLTF